MADESHQTQLYPEDLSAHEAKLQAWARSLDTTPERLKELVQGNGEGSQHVRQLLGIN